MIREFIYLDGDRLYSIYAQVFQGIAEKIVESFVNQLTSTDIQKSSLLTGAALETSTGEVTQRTENKLLHDYMYDQLEAKLAPALLDPAQLDRHELLEQVAKFPMLRVVGDAEIEDSRRMRTFLERFNEMGLAISYAARKKSQPDDDREPDFSGIKDKNARKRAQLAHRVKSDPKTLAREAGLQQDEQSLKNLVLFIDLFNPEGLEVLFSAGSYSGVGFKAVLNPRWLRIPADLLRTMHAGLPASNWTLVGHVTHFPGRSLSQPEERQDMERNIRDSYRRMFRAAREIEQLFFEGSQEEEIVIAPLAIYRTLNMEL